MKSYSVLLFIITIVNYSFSMKQSQEQSLLETSDKQWHVSFIARLPQELRHELQKFLQSHIIEAIKSALSLEEAIKNLKWFVRHTVYIQLFKDTKTIDSITYALAIKFTKAPKKLAHILKRTLKVESIKHWSEVIQPEQKLFFRAISNENFELVKRFIEGRVNVNCRNSSLRTPLIEAAYGKLDIAQYLLDHEADINAHDKYDVTALMRALNPEEVKLFLDYGANVNAQNKYGKTPLMRAAGSRYADNRDTAIVKLLLEYGADVTIKDNEGKTALDHAQKRDNQDIIKLLEEAIAKQQK